MGRMGYRRCIQGFDWKTRKRTDLKNLDVDGRIWIFRKWEGVVRTGWSWVRIGTGGGHL